MIKPSIISLVPLLLALCFTMPAFAEEDASMHQVYMAAESGNFKQAQSMMDQVLRDHPNSAKAHFVEAELLAKQGLFSNAGVELKNAERLQPGLPFAKPEAVQNLKNLISSASNGVMQPNNTRQNMPSAAKEWMPTILLVSGIALVVLLIGLIMNRRNTGMAPANSYGNVTRQNMTPVGPGGNGVVMGQPATGGMGSGLMGSLATGAAMGAGVVAGEALMHHFIDGDKNNVIPEPPLNDVSPWATSTNVNDSDDMGGADFGIADASSWDDDVSSDGGDDWT